MDLHSLEFLKSAAALAYEDFLVLASPTSRLYYLNLIVTFAFVCVWTLFRRDRTSLTQLLSKKHWWNASTKTDFKLHALNSLIQGTLIAIWLKISFEISNALLSFLIQANGGFVGFKANALSMTAFAIGVFIFDDFTRFALHLLTHRWPWLWNRHKTHHSATTLTPLTVSRVHPIETTFASLRQFLVNTLSVAFFIWLFREAYNPYTFLGVSAIPFVSNLLLSNLRHSSVPVSFGKFEYFYMSPKQHQIHHSKDPQFHHCNFGDALALWDYWNDSLCLSKESPDEIIFGLSEQISDFAEISLQTETVKTSSFDGSTSNTDLYLKT